MKNFIKNNLHEAQTTLENFLNNDKNMQLLSDAVDLLVDTFKNEKNVFSCGNGGSMCDAMHFAEELTGRFRDNRPALPATAISDPSHMSCVANDYGYDFVFSKYVEAFGKQGDVLVAISTSGNSKNVIEATKAAKQKGMKVIGLLGKDGGQLSSLVDLPIIVETTSKYADRIQEIHIKIIHNLIEGVERSLFPENYN